MADRKRSRARRILIVLGLLAVAGVAGWIATWRNTRITVSPETTFITEPLRDDGTVDYLAAIDRRYAEGVTPENNAAVVLEAVGVTDQSPEDRRLFFDRLGVAPPPEGSPRLEHFPGYFARKSGDHTTPDDWDREHDRVMSRPWTKADSPIAAAWLEEYREQIDLIAAATRRPRFYVPILPKPDPPGSASRPGLALWAYQRLYNPVRADAIALYIRAMFRLGQGQTEESWQDLLACHRLARLADQTPLLEQGRMACQIEEGASRCDTVLAREGKLTAEQARRFAAELRKLPPMTNLADRLDWAERLKCLDGVLAASVGGEPGDSQRLMLINERDANGDLYIPYAMRLGIALTDWNEPMREANRWYDRLVAAQSKPARPDRLAAMADIRLDAEETLARAKGAGALVRSILSTGSPSSVVAKRIAAAYPREAIGLYRIFADQEDETAVWRDLAQLAFALAAYRAEHDEYPVDLAALAPSCLPAVPDDTFAAGPFHYRRDGEGYLLYSVGPNSKDNGGRSHSDDPKRYDPDADDIVIRVPARQK